MPSRADSGFRPDINGLRAWAVMAVVLYHFGVPGFDGGFVGVDVFFVISGFLMTGIIINGLDGRGGGHGFSLWRFYLARARRILPALIVLCAVLLALGWFALPATDYRVLATHTLMILAFVSNLKFWREAGYFDVASHDKWLLHTWSLSVEWQFYLLLPLALMLLWRYWPGRRNALMAVGVATLLSFAASVLVTARDPATAFFLLPSRAWEMLAGGIVFLLAGQWGPSRPRITEVIGFGLVLLSIFTANAQTWPGYQAMLPVVGTCLVLMAARSRSWWTTPAPMQQIGCWSYSIYLWHWPLAVALSYLELQNSPAAVIGAVFASVALGALSYRWVEEPGRAWLGRAAWAPALTGLAGASLLVALPAGAVRLADGVSGRMPAEVERAANEARNVNQRRAQCHVLTGKDFRPCVYGGPNLRAVLVGDSHASTVATAVQAALPQSTDGVLVMSYTSCPTLLGARHVRPDLYCAEFNDWALAQIDALPHADYLHEYADRLLRSACTLARERRVYLLRPIPEMTVDVPRVAARKLLLGKQPEVSISLDEYQRRHAFILAAQDRAVAVCGSRVQVLDTVTSLCSQGTCSGMDGGRPRYYDDNHLSEFGNRRLVDLFEAILKTTGGESKPGGNL